MPTFDPDYQVQLDCAARMEADAFFADIAVLIQRKGVTADEIRASLGALNTKNGKAGAVVIVRQVRLVPRSAEAPGPEYTREHSFQVIEAPAVNDSELGTGKPAEQICRNVRRLFHYMQFSPRSALAFAGSDPDDLEDGATGYTVKFTERCIDERAPKVPPPEISIDSTGPVVATLESAVAGAAIYYTTDGSYPAPGNTAATLYAAPATIAASCTLRAVAYAAGYDASNVSTESITIS